MRVWPWSESRQQIDATDAIVQGLLSLAGGQSPTPDATATAAATSAVTAISGMLATARPSAFPEILTPGFLADFAARMALRGEAVYVIDVEGGLSLTGVHGVKIAGSWQPRSWTYEVELPRPSDPRPIVRRLPAEGIVHVKWGESTSEPWQGRSPLTRAGLTAKQLAFIERSLSTDAEPRSGQILPQPDGISPKAVQQVRAAITKGLGGISLIETQAPWLWSNQGGRTCERLGSGKVRRRSTAGEYPAQGQ